MGCGRTGLSEEELRAIDEAIAELDRGEAATPEQVKAAFAAFRLAFEGFARPASIHPYP
jgi:hypothetical protein